MTTICIILAILSWFSCIMPTYVLLRSAIGYTYPREWDCIDRFFALLIAVVGGPIMLVIGVLVHVPRWLSHLSWPFGGWDDEAKW